MFKKIIAVTFLAASFAVLFNPATVSAEEVKKADPESIFARVGGQAAVDATVDLFYTKVLADDRVNYLFEDINMDAQIRKQKEFIGAALGGPVAWEGRDMRRAHRDLDLTEVHFGAIAEHLSASLKELKVDDKLIGEIMTVVASTKDDVLNKPKKSGAE